MSTPALKIQLLRKLWAHLTSRETFGLMSPDRIQRLGLTMGEVRRQELSHIHNIERQLNELRRGYLEMDGEGRLTRSAQSLEARDVAFSTIIEFAGESPAAQSEPPSLGDMVANARLLSDTESLGRLLRLQKVYLLTERMILGMSPSVIDKGMLDPRWFSRWRIGVSEIPNGAMQQMWARILLRELIKPGSNSMRALDCLAGLTLEDAELLNRLAGVVVGDFVCRTVMAPGADQEPPEWCISLEELGVLRGVSDSQLTRSLRSVDSNKFVLRLTMADKEIVLTGDNPSAVVTLPAYRLTAVGRDVIPLFSAPADGIALEHILGVFQSAGLSIEVLEIEAESRSRQAS